MTSIVESGTEVGGGRVWVLRKSDSVVRDTQDGDRDCTRKGEEGRHEEACEEAITTIRLWIQKPLTISEVGKFILDI